MDNNSPKVCVLYSEEAPLTWHTIPAEDWKHHIVSVGNAYAGGTNSKIKGDRR